MKLNLLLLDADVVIDAHSLGMWDKLLKCFRPCDQFVTILIIPSKFLSIVFANKVKQSQCIYLDEFLASYDMYV